MKRPALLPRVPHELVSFVEFFTVTIAVAIVFFLLLRLVIPVDVYAEFRGIVGTLAFLLAAGSCAWGFEYADRHRHH